MKSTQTCVVIVGPTAVGKTATAIELAKSLRTEIISADSRQCYQELTIGVAKPDSEQLREVKHYFINSHSIQQEVHAALFEQYALTAISTIFSTAEHAVMVGGTGLYVDAFCKGMDMIPAIETSVRDQLNLGYQEKGLAWLQETARSLDPEYFEAGEILNPHRLIRALEVKMSTGNSIKFYQSSQKKEREFSIVKIGLELPREILYRRINDRVDQMLEAGLEEEVRSLCDYQHLNALNTVGYKELFDYIKGTVSFAEAVETIKKHTRHYAKRQITWFKKDPAVHWLEPGDQNAIEKILHR